MVRNLSKQEPIKNQDIQFIDSSTISPLWKGSLNSMHFKAREATVHKPIPSTLPCWVSFTGQTDIYERRIRKIYNMITEVLQYNSTVDTFILLKKDAL